MNFKTLFLVFVIVFAVGIQTLGQRLASLPIGNDTAVSNQVVKAIQLIEYGFANYPYYGDGFTCGDGKQEPYSQADGQLSEILPRKLKNFVESFVNSDKMDKTKITENFWLSYTAGNLRDGGLIYCVAGPIQFQQGVDGKFHLPDGSWNIPIDVFQTYEPIPARGVKWVDLAMTDPNGTVITSDMRTRNGAYGCENLQSLYGNGFLYLPCSFSRGKAIGSFEGWVAGGYVDLFYDEAGISDYDRFDLQTGAKIFSTAPPSLVIKPVGSGVQLSVIGAFGRQAVVESSPDNITWTGLSPALQGAIDSAPSCVYQATGTAKFFRARVAGGQPKLH